MLGLLSFLKGLLLIAREPQLWRHLLPPLLAGAVALLPFWFWKGDLWSFYFSWFPAMEQLSGWLATPLRWLFSLLSGLLLVATALLASLSVVKIVASPFNDLLSAEVEQIDAARGGEPLRVPPFWKSMVRAVRITAVQMVLFLLFLLPLWVLSMLLPGVGAVIASLLLLLYSSFWLAYDAMSYAMDRRLWRFRSRLRWMARHPLNSLGFGLGGYGLLMIPLLNLLLFPLLVSGGTLLLRRLEERDPLTAGELL